MHRSIGSTWGKWDLHVHTPATLLNNQFGGNTEEAWEEFLVDLASLPPSFKVLGINDYLFLDGYRRVHEAWVGGRLPQIELVLPVVEIRIDKFGGTTGKLSRVNFHAIFSNELPAELIEAQFINSLKVEARLHPRSMSGRPSFRGVPTRDAIADFGEQIIASVPEEERKKFGSPLEVGFNNLNFTLDSVRESLRSTYFEKNVLTAVGKTEWWNIKWTSQSIADKKDIVNGADFVFTAADGPGDCARSHAQLTKANVNNRLLDCSDAHSLSHSALKDRIGNCCTWLCADTEFEGLRQVRKEPGGRIYLGEEPPVMKRVREGPLRVIKTVAIERTDGSSDGRTWFDEVSIDLNPSLVAVIGKKGSGKSALADTIGLVGLTSRMKHASFLNPKRFRSGRLAKEFKGRMTWHAGPPTELGLHEDPPEGSVASLNFIPQDFFEEICNELIGHAEGPFDRELKRVIFTWVEKDDRLGHSTLAELLSHHVAEVEAAMHQRRGEVSKLNARIVSLSDRIGAAAERELDQELDLKFGELAAHVANRPVEVPAPPEQGSEPDAPELTGLAKALENAELAKTDAQRRRGHLVAQMSREAKVRARLRNLDDSVNRFLVESSADLEALGLSADQVVEFRTRLEPLDELASAFRQEKSGLDSQLDDSEAAPGELVKGIREAAQALEVAREQLEGPRRAYEEYHEAMRRWRRRRNQIFGDADDSDSLRGIGHRCRRLLAIPDEIKTLREKRAALVGEIHQDLLIIADIYRRVYRPVQEFIEAHPLVAEEFKLGFDVSIANANFEERFLARIHHGRMGTFMGKAPAQDQVKEILSSHDFNTTEGTIAFVENLLDALRRDRPRPGIPSREIRDQLVDGEQVEDLLDFICQLEYLAPRYRLRLGDRPVEQLSPGEKGALLLVFYLLVDKGEEPLLIDQPEGNLDNETVFSLLVPSIKQAKLRRQIIMVTHNPNLAVVCDAEQLVIAERAAHPDVELRYRAGAIENGDIRRAVLNILEGTEPAFLNRESKYLK